VVEGIKTRTKTQEFTSQVFASTSRKKKKQRGNKEKEEKEGTSQEEGPRGRESEQRVREGTKNTPLKLLGRKIWLKGNWGTAKSLFKRLLLSGKSRERYMW